MNLTVKDFMEMLKDDVKINAFTGYETETDRYYDYDIDDFVTYERDREVWEEMSKDEFARLYGDEYVTGIHQVNDHLITLDTCVYAHE